MLYRVLQRLSVGPMLANTIESGSVIGGEFSPRVTQILVEKGALSPLGLPPLGELPGWKLRAGRFEEAGFDAAMLLEGDDETIANDTGYNIRSIQKWKRELRDFLLIKKTEVKGCAKC